MRTERVHARLEAVQHAGRAGWYLRRNQVTSINRGLIAFETLAKAIGLLGLLRHRVRDRNTDLAEMVEPAPLVLLKRVIADELEQSAPDRRNLVSDRHEFFVERERPGLKPVLAAVQDRSTGRHAERALTNPGSHQ